jgi:hypothetical protein
VEDFWRCVSLDSHGAVDQAKENHVAANCRHTQTGAQVVATERKAGSIDSQTIAIVISLPVSHRCPFPLAFFVLIKPVANV